MRTPGSAGVPRPLRERFFAALLRREFSFPALAPIFMRAISLLLGVESAKQSPSPPPQFGPDGAAGLSERSSPLGERSFAALLRERFFSPALAPVFVGAIFSLLGVESAEQPLSLLRQFGADEDAGLRGRPSPLRGRFFAALLRGEFSSPALVPIFVGALSLSLRMESVARPPSPSR